MSATVKGCRTPAGQDVATVSTAGVGQASAEETAGGLGWVVLRAMGIVPRGLMAAIVVSTRGSWRQACAAVYRDQWRGFFSHHVAGMLPGKWG